MHTLALQSVDWVNAVIAPVIITLALGVPLSLWTGLIAGRYIEFYQRLRDARVIFMSVDAVLMTPLEQTFHKNELLRTQAIIQGTLYEQGQFKAQIKFNDLCEKMRIVYQALEQGVATAKAAKNVALNKIAFDQFNTDSTRLMAELQQIRPSLVSLLLGHQLSKYFLVAIYYYEIFRDYIETGQPIAEIRERREYIHKQPTI